MKPDKPKYYIVYEEESGAVASVDKNIYKNWDDLANKDKKVKSATTQKDAEAIRDAMLLIHNQQNFAIPALIGSAISAAKSDLNYWIREFDDLDLVKYSIIVQNNQIEMHLTIATEYLGRLFFSSAGTLKKTGLRGLKNTALLQPIIDATPSLNNRPHAVAALESLSFHHRLAEWLKFEYIAYVDGSYQEKLGGYGFAIFKKSENGTFHQPHCIEYGKITNPDYLDGKAPGTELFCLNKLCEWIDKRKVVSSSVFVCFDNDQAFWQAKGVYGQKSKSTKAFHVHQQSSAVKVSDLTLNWTKSHEGEFGNELVDRLADLGVSSSASFFTKATWTDIQAEGKKKEWVIPVCVKSGRQPAHSFVFEDDGAPYGALFPNKQSPIHPSVRMFGDYGVAHATGSNSWNNLIRFLQP